ncbi:hypothetical protein L1049_005707 [Liquidambar formosana]|uniref:Protein kinase domain-containing protein n=1 Tax=Liquidambar formosana TaxID=63359 RepID=A0AAP0WRZ5_LIQFO
MAPAYSPLFFLLSNIVILHSAGEEWGHHPEGCPPFDCGKLGKLQFPFSNTTTPSCGLCTVNCQKKQLQSGGKWYELESISQANIITIRDEAFHKRLKSNECETFNNLTLPSSPFGYFKITLNLTMYKCYSSLKSVPHSSFRNYTGCNRYNFSIYYTPNDSLLLTLPPQCSIIQLPKKPNPRNNEIFSLLSADISLELVVHPDCHKCYFKKRGNCHNNTKGEHPCRDHPNRVDAIWSISIQFYLLVFELTQNHSSVAENEKLELKLALGIGCPAILIICFLFFFLKRHYKQKYASSPFLSRNISSDPSSKSALERDSVYFGVLPIFSYGELEEATNYFDPTKELEDGGFGTVYQGKLRDGREVAVKRLYNNNYKRVGQFMNEVEILTRLRHKNLVSLYGCTSRHSRELLLVYEFIANGTVADHLYGDRPNPGSLTWPIRMSIAIETADALAYLHASDIIHRDVKTNNILLDNNFSVKVADFGLSRLFPTDVTHISTAPQGTPGYVDPEYNHCYQLTQKSDVYSFGVVLIELISSMPAIDVNRHRHEVHLANFAMNKIQKCAFSELIDPSLGFESNLMVRRMTTSVAELAFRCLQQDREMRPSMDDVLEVLKGIESEKYVLENMEEMDDDVGLLKTTRPPTSPDSDHVGLLKDMRLLSSPNPVTEEWVSRSTTSSASV